MKRAAVTALLGNGSRRGNPTAPKKRLKASGSVVIWFPRLIPSPSTPNSGPILKRTQVSLSVVGSKGLLAGRDLASGRQVDLIHLKAGPSSPQRVDDVHGKALSNEVLGPAFSAVRCRLKNDARDNPMRYYDGDGGFILRNEILHVVAPDRILWPARAGSVRSTI